MFSIGIPTISPILEILIGIILLLFVSKISSLIVKIIGFVLIVLGILTLLGISL